MINAITRSKPVKIHEIQIQGHKFILECDVSALRAGIESLRSKFDFPTYGYQYYKTSPLVEIKDEEIYQENIDDFLEELDKKLELKSFEKWAKKAKKKKDGTFWKNRVYDEYVLRNAESTGGADFKVYKLKYEIVGDTAMRLIIHRTSELWDWMN